MPHASALIQRDFRWVLGGTAGQKQIPHATKVDLVWQLGVYSESIVEEPWTACFPSAKIGRASRPGKKFNLVIDEEPLDKDCHVCVCVCVWSPIILL
ncbi:hypothetical protein TNCV_3248721 [Trichonephila clavipes]|nr:hypothetical protein TNCV_3248721 [Trichonephila clavipes]